jgi:protein-tyrosine phosphatase
MWYSEIYPFLYFGKYPETDAQKEELKKLDIDICVNLTSKFYTYDKTINFPIADQSIPVDEDAFEQLVRSLCVQLQGRKKIYIHCLNGRGRSALVASCIVGRYLDLSSEDAIHIVSNAHTKGHGQSRRWADVDLPVHKLQREFVSDFLDDSVSFCCCF